MATTNFALRTLPEFKDVAKALAETGPALLEPVPEKSSSFPAIEPGSINTGFNVLIARGLPAMLELVEVNLTENQAALDIPQEVMRFLLDHPAVRNALAINFAEGSGSRRVIEACDAANIEAAENGGAIREAVRGLSAAESKLWKLWHCFDDDITLEAASRALAVCQRKVNKLSVAKGALQRAMATQGEMH